jgi:hypothetical protein
MAKAYHIYYIENMPDLSKGAISVPCQLALLNDIEVPDTTLSLVTEQYHAGFAMCKVHHEIIVSIMGRTHGYVFNEFVRPYDFYAYIHARQRIIVFQGSSDVVSDAVNVMNKKVSGFELVRHRLDLKKLLPYVAYVKGAWFRMRNPNLAAQGLFGDHVDKDPSFDQALKFGESMSTMMLNFEHADRLFLTTLLQECGVVLYENMDTELELDLVLELKRSLMDVAIAE